MTPTSACSAPRPARGGRTPPQAALADVRAVRPDLGLFHSEDRDAVRGLATVVKWWLDALEQGHVRHDADSDTWRWPRRAEVRRSGASPG